MEIHYTTSIFSVAQSGDGILMITIPKDQKHLYDKITGFEDDKLKTLAIDYHKEKRTVTANSYMFVLLSKIAKKLGLPLGDCYVKFIRDFGVSVGMFCSKEAFPTFERSHNKTATSLDHEFSMCVITKEYMKGFNEWVEFEAFLGSSVYTKKEFAHLVDGVVETAKEMDIEVMAPQEIQSLIDKMEEL